MERQVDPSTPLDIAIETVSEATLRDIFKAVCNKSSEARRLAAGRLLVESPGQGEEGVEGGKSPDGNAAQKDDRLKADSVAATHTLKRPISRYATCENCEIEFDVTTNTSKSCTYHPEDAKPTEDMYEDIYEGDEQFEIDSLEMRQDFPDFFVFQCCESTWGANPKGCITDWHRAESPGLKKQRFRV
ncbi:hypothetical protein BJX62DRAFT_194146 [Aspergillus germanicus]